MSLKPTNTVRLTTQDDKEAPKELLIIGESLGVTAEDFSVFARETIHRIFKKLIFDKNAPAPQLPASEKPQSDIPTDSLSLQERAKQNPALKEALENINQPLPPPPCHYLAKGYTDKKTGITYIFCNGEKMPLTVCMNLYERHRAKNKQCIPQNIKAQQKKKFEQKYLRHPKVDWDTNPWG